MNVSGLSSRLRRGAALGMAMAAAALGASCASDTTTQGQGGSYVILEALEAASGGAESPDFATVLQSDVQTNGGVYEDPGRVRMRIGLKDLGTIDNPNAPSNLNFITINRYRVTFRRSDGRNTPGQDVPYAFDGGVTFTVGAQPSTATFSIVRAQAKLEAPLIALAGGGGALVISTLADVQFWGRDQAGNDVTVSGTISINFADWADPKS